MCAAEPGLPRDDRKWGFIATLMSSQGVIMWLFFWAMIPTYFRWNLQDLSLVRQFKMESQWPTWTSVLDVLKHSLWDCECLRVINWAVLSIRNLMEIGNLMGNICNWNRRSNQYRKDTLGATVTPTDTLLEKEYWVQQLEKQTLYINVYMWNLKNLV